MQILDVPWPYFEQHRTSKINREYELGYILQQVYESRGMFPRIQTAAETIEKQELIKELTFCTISRNSQQRPK
jgi:hypothetical protein